MMSGVLLSVSLLASAVADALNPFVERGELVGGVSVLVDGDRTVVDCVGFADAETKRPVTVDDVFMQCSQTKGFCGVTAAILIEEERLGLDDPVSRYLPEFACKSNLTVRMCLNHTAGFDFELPNYEAMGGWHRRMPFRSVAAVAASLPLLFKPGTKVRYSNVGIDVAAAVIEVVSRQRWEDFLKARVLDPLDMAATTFRPSSDVLKRRMSLYSLDSRRLPRKVDAMPQMAPPYDDDRVFPSAGAGLWTTVRDQLKFYRMLMNLGRGDNGVRILKEETVRKLLARSTRPRGVRNIYGDIDDDYSLGLVAPPEDTDDAWFGHGGAWGTQAMVNYHRKQLSLWAYQLEGMPPHPWKEARERVAEDYFKRRIESGSVDAHTGRLN